MSYGPGVRGAPRESRESRGSGVRQPGHASPPGRLATGAVPPPLGVFAPAHSLGAGFGLPLLVLLLLANLAGVASGAPAIVSTTVLIVSVLAVLYLTLEANRTARIPPLLDIGFHLGVLVYYVLPAVAPLLSDVDPLVTLPLQQGLVGSAVIVFTIVRSSSGWRGWKRIVERLDKPVPEAEHAYLWLLFVVTALWFLLSVYFVRDQFFVQYGTRAPGQRNPLTIVLLGFDYFGIVLASVLHMRLVRDRRASTLALSVLAVAAFGLLTFLAFSVRTKFFWGLSLAASLLLLRYRLTVRRLVLVSLSVVVVIPFLAFTSRLRTELHTGDLSVISESLARTASLSFGDMLGGSEPVNVTTHAEEVIDLFGGERLYGRYVGLAILKSPPAFVLRLVGFDEVQSLSGEYVRYRHPSMWEDGGGLGLALSAESYCNLGMLGGVFSGVVLALFCMFMEFLAGRFTPPWLALPHPRDVPDHDSSGPSRRTGERAEGDVRPSGPRRLVPMRPGVAEAQQSGLPSAPRAPMTDRAGGERRSVESPGSGGRSAQGLGAFALSVIGIYALTFVSRTIGLLRDSLLARYLGASESSDAFFLGSWLPFYVINVVNMAVTPLIIRELVRDESGAGGRPSTSYSTLLLLIAAPLAMMAAGGRSLLLLSNPETSADRLGDAYAVLAVTCLFGFVTSANYVLAAVANSRHRFVVPRLLDTLSPIGACVGILLLLNRFGLVGISVGMLVAALIAHGGYRALLAGLGERVPSTLPSLRDVGATLATVLPYVLGCIFVNGTFLALMRQVSLQGAGNVTLVMLSDRIWSIVRSATAAVTLAAMPRMAEAESAGEGAGRRVVLPAVYGMAALFTAAVGFLLVAGEPVVRFLFHHGLFASDSAERLSTTVQWYGAAAGLVAIGYFLEYHMIAIGRSAKTVWGGGVAAFVVSRRDPALAVRGDGEPRVRASRLRALVFRPCRHPARNASRSARCGSKSDALRCGWLRGRVVPLPLRARGARRNPLPRDGGRGVLRSGLPRLGPRGHLLSRFAGEGGRARRAPGDGRGCGPAGLGTRRSLAEAHVRRADITLHERPVQRVFVAVRGESRAAFEP